MMEFLESDPQPELLKGLSTGKRKALKKFIKTQYPYDLERPDDRERALTIIQLIEILEEDL
jgi:hypothetical protein